MLLWTEGIITDRPIPEMLRRREHDETRSVLLTNTDGTAEKQDSRCIYLFLKHLIHFKDFQYCHPKSRHKY